MLLIFATTVWLDFQNTQAKYSLYLETQSKIMECRSSLGNQVLDSKYIDRTCGPVPTLDAFTSEDSVGNLAHCS